MDSIHYAVAACAFAAGFMVGVVMHIISSGTRNAAPVTPPAVTVNIAAPTTPPLLPVDSDHEDFDLFGGNDHSESSHRVNSAIRQRRTRNARELVDANGVLRQWLPKRKLFCLPTRSCVHSRPKCHTIRGGADLCEFTFCYVCGKAAEFDS